MGYRLCQAVFLILLWPQPQLRDGETDVLLPLLRIIQRQWSTRSQSECTAHQFGYFFSQIEHREFARIADVDRTRAVGRRVHYSNHRINGIIHIYRLYEVNNPTSIVSSEPLETGSTTMRHCDRLAIMDKEIQGAACAADPVGRASAH